MNKKDLIRSVLLELKSEGYDVEGMVDEEGVMGGNYGLIEWGFFDDVDDEELRDYLIDFIEECYE